MDPGTILAVVSASIGLATKLQHLYKRVNMYIGKTKSVPEFFQTLSANILLLMKTLESSGALIGEPKPSDYDLTPIDGLVKRLQFLLQRLDDGLSDVIPSDGESRRVILWKAFKSIRFEEEAARLWEQIEGCCFSLTLNRTFAANPDGTRDHNAWMPPITDIPQYLQVPFVGREGILSEITNRLSTGNKFDPPTVVLHGMGGQGKTQLALQFCTRNRERSGTSTETSEGYRAILWVDATSEAATREAFLRIHDLIKDSDSVLQDVDARIQQVKMIIQRWHLPWLIVFDNYDDPPAFPSIRNYMPIPRGKGAVLVTSRHEETKSIGDCLDVPALSKSEGMDLLRNQISDKTKFEAPGAGELAERILEKLGYHALAIYQAGCFIQRNDCSMVEFLDQYGKEPTTTMSWTPSIWPYKKPAPGDNRQQIAVGVFATFRLAFDALQCDKTPTDKIRRFLTICSYLSIKAIPTSLFLASSADEIDALDIFREQNGCALDTAKLQAIVKVLREHGLIQPSIPAKKNVFSIHPLVSDWLKTSEAHSGKDLQALQLEDGMLASRIIRNCLEAVVKDLAHGYLDIPFDIRQELLPHVLACETTLLQSACAKDPLDGYRTCHIFADFLDSCGSSSDVAQRIQEEAIEVLKDTGDTADQDSAKATSSICLLARIYHHRGKHDQATVLLEERLHTVKDSFKAGDTGAIQLAELLASALCYQRKFDEAAAWATDVLNVREKYHSENKRALLQCRGALAWIWQHSGKAADAEREEKAILAEMRQSFEPNDLDTLTCLNGLGCIFLSQGKLEEANSALSEAVEGRKERLGLEHPSTLNARTNLSMVLASQERWQEAVQECGKILDTREARLGRDHVSTLVSVANLLEVGKFAPRDIFDEGKIGSLEDRLNEAMKHGLWQKDWTAPAIGDLPSNWSQTVTDDVERPGQRRLAWRIGSIWRPLRLLRATPRRAAQASSASCLSQENAQRIFQSQMQHQQ